MRSSNPLFFDIIEHALQKTLDFRYTKVQNFPTSAPLDLSVFVFLSFSAFNQSLWALLQTLLKNKSWNKLQYVVGIQTTEELRKI